MAKVKIDKRKYYRESLRLYAKLSGNLTRTLDKLFKQQRILASKRYAQNEIITSPFLVASSGETWIQENYILCFSVGELAIETKTQQNTILTQGFHQEENYQITALNEHLNNYSINIYPNPTSDILNINCSDETYVGIKIKDIKGQVNKLMNNYKIFAY